MNASIWNAKLGLSKFWHDQIIATLRFPPKARGAQHSLRLVNNEHSAHTLLNMSTPREPPHTTRLRLTPAQVREIAASLSRPFAYDAQQQPQTVRMRWQARMACTRFKPEVKATAANLLAELRAEAGLPVQPPPPLHRTVSKKVLADARLLLMLSKPLQRDQESPPKTSRTARCGRCDECRKGDCGTCYNCQDKRRFGGQGIRKQACKMRRCVYARSVVQTCTKE